MWKHYWVSVGPPYVPAECSAEGLLWNVRRRLHSNLCKIYTIPVDCGWPLATKEVKFPEDDFADSQRRFWGLDNLRSPKDCFEDSHKTNPWVPGRQFCRPRKVDSAGSPHTIRKFPHRFSWKVSTDFQGSRWILVSSLCPWHFHRNKDYVITKERRTSTFTRCGTAHLAPSVAQCGMHQQCEC